MIRLLFILALLTGCGRDDAPLEVGDPAFLEALDLYLAYAPDHGKLDLLRSIRWEEPKSAANRAECNRSGSSPLKEEERRILIRPGSADGYVLRALVLHELGHCLHDFDHSPTPGAIMELIPKADQEYWREYTGDRLYELFHGEGAK